MPSVIKTSRKIKPSQTSRALHFTAYYTGHNISRSDDVCLLGCHLWAQVRLPLKVDRRHYHFRYVCLNRICFKYPLNSVMLTCELSDICCLLSIKRYSFLGFRMWMCCSPSVLGDIFFDCI